MTTNKLKIRAQSLDLELTGDTAYIEDAYMAMRHVIMERFQNTLANPSPSPASSPSPSSGPSPASPEPAARTMAALEESLDEPTETRDKPRERQDTNPMYKAIARQIAKSKSIPENTVEAADTPLHTVICGEVYYNISIVARGQLDKSIFGKALTARLIERVYVNESEQAQLAKHLTFGKILWRELTPVGQSVIGRGGGKP